MYLDESVWLHMRDGYRPLSLDREGRLTLSDPMQASRILVQPQSVESFSACMDGGIAHVLVNTRSGSLLYGATADGRKWRKFTLTRVERDQRIRDPILFARSGSVHILYIAGYDQTETLVHYQQNPAGSWSGRTLDSFTAEDRVRLLQVAAYRDDLYLFVLSGGFNKAKVRRYSLLLEPGAWREALLAPLPFTDFQVCCHQDELHMCWLSDGRVYADGTPLSWSGQCRMPCMQIIGDTISCTWVEPDGARKMTLGRSGWQPDQAPRLVGDPALHILLEDGYAIRSLLPPALSAVSPVDDPIGSPYPEMPNRSEQQVQRMASQMLMLYRQLSERIDRLQGEVDSLHASLSGSRSHTVEAAPQQREPEQASPSCPIQQDGGDDAQPAPHDDSEQYEAQPVRIEKIESPVHAVRVQPPVSVNDEGEPGE
ncbi:MAG: hypothetical protein ACOX7W_01815 [Christensenellales bacterium]|jgi:hypothetical protein